MRNSLTCLLVLIAVLVVWAGPSLALLPDNEVVVTSIETVVLASGSVGASGILDAKAVGGDGTIYFARLADDGVTVLARWPRTGTLELAAEEPRPFDMTGDQPNRAYVNPGTATKVLVTW